MKLEDTQLEELNIRHFKLINGDNILALVVKKEQGRIIIERPVQISNNMMGGFQLSPWFAFSSQTLYTLLEADIMAHVLIDYDIKATYIKAVTADKLDPEIIAEDESNIDIEYEKLIQEAIESFHGTKKVLH